MKLNWRRIGALAVLGLGVGWAGCGKIELPKSIEEAKQAVSETVETVKEQAPAAPSATKSPAVPVGSIELTAGEPVKTGGCYGRILAFSAGRPAVLQLTSYEDARAEAFPSVFLRAQLPEGAAEALAGQTVQAEVYVRVKADGPILHSAADRPVELKITAADGATIAGEVTLGQLVSTDGGNPVDVTGKFTGSMR